MGKDAFEKFGKLVTEVFLKFCEVEGVSFGTMAGNVEWINPQKSMNSISGWGA